MRSPLPFSGLFEWAADLSPLPDFLLKVTVILVLGWLGAFLLRGRNPYWRVFLWRSVAVALLILPILAGLTPRFSLVVAQPAELKPPLLRPFILAPTENRAPPLGPIPLIPLDDATPPPSGPFYNVPLFLRLPPPFPEGIPTVGFTPGTVSEQRDQAPLFWIWGIGVVLLVARLSFSHRKVRSFVRQSSPAPEVLAARLREVAEDLGIRDRISIRISPSFKTPFLTGIFRPMLVLPAEMAEPDFEQDLPAVLAHELGHVRTQDLSWGWVFHLIGIALWPHPMVWRVRKSHAAACEEVCDATAAEYIGSSEAYTSILARVAFNLHSSPPAACGIAMARTSNVGRRLAALERLVAVRPLTRRRIAMALTASFAILLLVAAIDFVRAEPQVVKAEVSVSGSEVAQSEKSEEESETPQAGPTLTLRLVDKASQAAIPDATVLLRVNASGGCNNFVDTPIRTDSEGEATLVTEATDPVAFGFRVSLPGYVPMGGMWYRENEPKLGSKPDSVSVEMEKGATIGGIVTDETGIPVEGVEVDISIYNSDTNRREEPVRFSLGRLLERTGTDGRWTCSHSPQSLAGYRVNLSFSHPEYVFERSWNPDASAEISRLRDGTYDVRLKKGSSLSGRVVDELGNPIEGATAKIGRHSPEEQETKSDADGVFVIEHVSGHSHTLVVTVDGFAPTVMQAAPSGGGTGFLVEMKRGLPLRGRVVDEEGSPIKGAFLAPDSAGHSILEEVLNHRMETDSDGRFVWLHSPSETLQYSVNAKGFQSIRPLELPPGETEHLVTLHPPIRVSGRVMDAVTLEPVRRFDLIPGVQWRPDYKQVTWQESSGWVESFEDGSYEIDLYQGHPGMALRVRAEGYADSDSPIYPRDASREIEYDFLLVRKSLLTSRILDRDGNPLVSATVVVCTTESGGYIRNGLDASAGSAERVTTDGEGRFEFEKPKGAFAVICAHEEGFAKVAGEDFDPQAPIRIQPWGRVEGQVMKGPDPSPSESVRLNFEFVDDPRKPRCHLDYRTTADSEGRFVFEHVFPGPASVGREVHLGSVGIGFRTTSSHGKPIRIQSDRTTATQIGGTGRPVIGRFAMPLNSGETGNVQWGLVSGRIRPNLSSEEEVARREKLERGEDLESLTSYCSIAQEDGSFRVEDIPAGNYILSARIPKPNANDPHEGSLLGQISKEFTVPPVEGVWSPEPFDLGTLEVAIFVK